MGSTPPPGASFLKAFDSSNAQLAYPLRDNSWATCIWATLLAGMEVWQRSLRSNLIRNRAGICIHYHSLHIKICTFELGTFLTTGLNRVEGFRGSQQIELTKCQGLWAPWDPAVQPYSMGLNIWTLQLKNNNCCSSCRTFQMAMQPFYQVCHSFQQRSKGLIVRCALQHTIGGRIVL